MYSRKRKQGVYWYSDFFYKGKRYTKCHGIMSKTVAKEKEREFRNAVASGEYEEGRKKVLFRKFAQRYLEYSKTIKRPSSYRRDESSVERLLTFFSGKYLSEITPWLIEKYRKERLKEVKKATVNRERACLSNMFQMAKKWSLAKVNPAQEVKRYREELKDVKPLTSEKEKELFDRFDKHPKSRHVIALVLTALNTGMRKREILDLTKDNVDFKKRIIHVIHTKNWEVRDIPMNETLTKVLEEVIGENSKDNPYVFANPKTGKPYRDIKTSYSKAVKKIGLEGFTFHMLRHTWCSRMCELGVDEATIMEIGGWKTRSMINRYAHPSMDHKREALEKLNKVPLILPLVEEDKHPSKSTTPLNSVNI